MYDLQLKRTPALQYRKKLNLILRNWQLYVLIFPVLIYFIAFHYFPMYGVQIAFKNFMATKGIWGSQWVGFTHFQRLFNSYYFIALLKNTLGISILQLVVGFPVPIILALMINEISSRFYKKTVQLVTYAPHFLSTVVLVGMLLTFVSPRNGIINEIIKMLGGEPIFFMSKAEWFKPLYVISGVWQNAGWNSIIYIAALSGIDTQLHEAAKVDGAGRLKRIWHINIPGIMPTMVILLILNMGSIMSVGFEKVFLMQNDMIMDSSDVISTFVYRNGLMQAQFSFSAAVGLFNSVINFTLLIIVNRISRAVSASSLW